MNSTQQKIESLLFYKNEPLSFSLLSKYLQLPIAKIREEVEAMLPHYHERGVVLLVAGEKVSLRTAEISRELIAHITKSKEERELSKQALETIAIILYREGITKAEIDYIRGVNSVYILRNLLMRGLIEKKPNKRDKRSPLFVISPEALAFLGITAVHELPEFDIFSQKIKNFLKQQQEESSHSRKEEASTSQLNEE